MEIPHY